MPPKQRKDVNKGKNIASSSLPDPAVTNQVNRPPPATVTNGEQANPTAPAAEQPAAITRTDLDRVVVEVTPNHGMPNQGVPGQIAPAQAHRQLYTSKTPAPSLTL